jgi:hypothetical protein
MIHWTYASTIQLLCSKLKCLKRIVIQWQRDKKLLLQSELLHIESKTAKIFDRCPSQIFDQVDLDTLKSLKLQKEKILTIEESSWRLKSRAIWLSCGDKNTKFFHKYANMRRTQNSIWDIEDESGTLHTSDSDIKNIALTHFQAQFKANEVEDTHCQLKVLDQLPKFLASLIAKRSVNPFL